tara:strand:- start:199 stop:690 length:492 start_codon:yes stop_codon:yes gene_type:complete
MTYFAGPTRFNFNTILLKTMGSTTVGLGNYVKFTESETLAGSPETTFTSSTGLITLPNKPCILTAGLYYSEGAVPDTYGYLEYQFYDATNSQAIGNKARVVSLRLKNYINNVTQSYDESAIVYAQNINVYLKITANQTQSGTTLDGSQSNGRAIKSKIVIYEF